MKFKNQKTERAHLLEQCLKEHILVLDGAMGTALQNEHLKAEDFGGEAFEGCNEQLILTRPDLVEKIHASYLEAGADIVETNTFGATPLVLSEYGLEKKAFEINFEAARLARKVAERFSTQNKPRFVAGSVGPTTKSLSVTGGITFEALVDHFYLQAKGLYEGGVDYFLLETCQDTRNIKAGIFGVQQFLNEAKIDVPIAVSVTIEAMGTLLAGQPIEAVAASLNHFDLLYLGLNCATGPEFMTDPLRSLAGLTRFRTACVPNAGLPDVEGRYLETPEMVATVVGRFAESGWLNIVGGCCGTTPAHIRALATRVREIRPRSAQIPKRSFISGIDYLEITDELRPVIVGERTNVIGSRQFKRLIADQKFEEASEIAKMQAKNGAQIIDVCMADPDRDEVSDMVEFLKHAVSKVRTPFMIDSTDAEVFKNALPYLQGKAILNSINLEDGEERFEHIVPLAKKFGAALVVGLIDEDKNQGMAVTRARKLEIARRSYQLLTEKFGIAAEDIYWDALVFPIGTGDENYAGSAIETIEGIRTIKKEFPETKTILGVSNVSFGLPPAGREVLNAVYLYHCVQAGLDLAIVNAEKLERYASIPEEERRLAEDLIWNRNGQAAIQAFAEFFRSKKVENKSNLESLSLEERLARYVIEGTKSGLTEDLSKALETSKPLEIINGPLMKGMDEVGRLFNKNELIVAEVLQSAEVMKAAVAYLEPLMDKLETASRGKVLLATVKGDVHDIGKNLVDIILSNNGFSVINLGIKIPPEQLILSINQHKPDLIGLSGLLVKSAQQMVLTAEDLKRSGIDLPILVGGAALSKNFTDQKIQAAYDGIVAYAKDAMEGLEIAKKLRDPKQSETFKNALKARQKESFISSPINPKKQTTDTQRSKTQILSKNEIPNCPDFERHVLKNTPVDHLFHWINPQMLYGRHLGVKGKTVKAFTQIGLSDLEKDPEHQKMREIFEVIETLKTEARTGLLKPAAVYQFFRAKSVENRLVLFDQKDRTLGHFDFPRQAEAPYLCLADYVREAANDEADDQVCLFVVTAGKEIRERAEDWKEKGDYLKSFALQALALETAEAYAEFLHAKIRSFWGFPDPAEMTMLERFQAKYRGRRYSPGYPACPRLEDQQTIFNLLDPREIGVELTEGFMMDPEASVSAIVFHHPEATYFGVGSDILENR